MKFKMIESLSETLLELINVENEIYQFNEEKGQGEPQAKEGETVVTDLQAEGQEPLNNEEKYIMEYSSVVYALEPVISRTV
jgi:hypothetical protein